MELKLIATGTGRCGTVFIARFLTQLGIPCGHESLFDFHGYQAFLERLSGERPIELSEISRNEAWVDPKDIVADSSYGAAPFLCEEKCKTIPVLHIVRNPMHVVSSFVRDFNYFALAVPNDNHWQDFIYSHLPALTSIPSNIDRACYFYVHWNKMIMNSRPRRRYMIHKIEDGLTPRLLRFLGFDGESHGISRIPNIPTNANSRKKPGALPTLLRNVRKGPIKDEFVAFAKELGYMLQ